MKLIYFPVRGRAETARLMLALAGVQYEFEGMAIETWRAEGKTRMLERTPFGQLPLLEDGAFTLCQAQAINHYLARKLELDGRTIEERARVDEVSEAATEMMVDFAMLFWNPQFTERRAEHRETTATKLEHLQRYFSRTSADAEHWVLPGRYTMADAAMAFSLESYLPLHPGLVEEFPKLHHVMTAFFGADGVRDYVRSDRRPRTWTIHFAPFGGKPEETHQWTG